MIWRNIKDRIERLIRGPVKYYRKRGARIGAVGYFDWPIMAEPHLCEIGDNVWVTSGVVFLNHDGAIAMFNRAGVTDAVNVVGRIIVENNVFIGMRSILMAGVRIGCNSVVASGSVVTKDVPSGTVVGGCPAKVICTVKEYLERYASADRTLWIQDEAQIQNHVVEKLMNQSCTGKFAIRLCHGKTKLTQAV